MYYDRRDKVDVSTARLVLQFILYHPSTTTSCELSEGALG